MLFYCLLFLLSVADVTKIAIGSCYGQFKNTNPRIFESIADDDPDLFIWLGDSIYGDLVSFPKELQIDNLSSLKSLYNELLTLPEYSKLANKTKITGTWDDHDFGINDGDSSFFLKFVTRDLFLDFIGDRVDYEGVYRDYEFDPRIKLIILDIRYFRIKEKDILGELQFSWLEEQLKDRREITFIASGVQINVEDRYSATEQWDDISRMRLLNMIKDIPGVILLTGDIHFGEILRNNCWKYPIMEITASGLTHTEYTLYGPLAYWYLSMCNAMSYHETPRVLQKHFGTINIKWEEDLIDFYIKDTYGTILRHQSIKITELYENTQDSYLCHQQPFERHINHLLSCFLVFHVPVILFVAYCIVFFKKYTHKT